MAEKQGLTKAEKLYNDLAKRSKVSALSESEVLILLAHPLIANDVSGGSDRNGSHLYTVKVSEKAIQQHWGHTSFNIVIHNRQVKKSYVDDLMKLIGFMLELHPPK